MKLFFRTSTLFALFFSVISLSLPDAVEAKTGKVIKKPLSVAKSKSAKKSVKKSLAKTSGLKKTKVVAKSGSTFKDRVKARKAELLAEPARLPGRIEVSRLTEQPVLASVQVPVDAVSTVESLIHELGVEEVDEAQARMGEAAFSLLGKRYRFGGNGASGIDCSAFVRTVFNRLQIPLPRTAREQFALGVEVPVTDLQKGDLLFFHTYRDDASHVGIYLGNDKMIHASSSGRRVMISSTKNAYYRARFLGARRVTADSVEAAPVRNPDASLRPVLELVAESGLRAPISF